MRRLWIILLLFLSMVTTAQIVPSGYQPSSTLINKVVTNLIYEYEQQLPTILISVPCDCYPCAMRCYEETEQEPEYEDFIQFIKEYNWDKYKYYGGKYFINSPPRYYYDIDSIQINQ